jgi:LTXXQ motif family protein
LLLAAVLVVCVASSADARRRHHGYYGGYGERTSTRSLDEWRRAPDVQGGQQDSQPDRAQTPGQDQARDQDRSQDSMQDRARDRDRRRARYDEWRRSRYEERRWRDRDEWRRARYDDWRRGRGREEWIRARAVEGGDAVLRPGRNGPFGAVVEKLIRGCAAQAAEFDSWPFDTIGQSVGADEKQRNALEGLRGVAKQAAERLAADCPQDVPAAPSARLEAVEQGIDAALKAFDTVQPALQTFYGALDDEQKARLYRDMAASAAATVPQTTGRRDARDRRAYSSRRDRWRAYAAEREAAAREATTRGSCAAAAPGWGAACEQLATVLRGWPGREIERDVRLDGSQRVAFYELVTASLKAADTLGSACPAETALTPVGRMETMRKRLAAVRAATARSAPRSCASTRRWIRGRR